MSYPPITRDVAQRFFDSYCDAFLMDDADRVTAHWCFPSIFSTARDTLTLEPASFRASTADWCAFYKRRGVAAASKTVVDLLDLGSGATAVTTRDAVRDAANVVIAEWQYGYVLRATADGPKLIATTADDELRTWAARGTPMGS